MRKNPIFGGIQIAKRRDILEWVFIPHFDCISDLGVRELTVVWDW